jgi:hypothetical protein
MISMDGVWDTPADSPHRIPSPAPDSPRAQRVNEPASPGLSPMDRIGEGQHDGVQSAVAPGISRADDTVRAEARPGCDDSMGELEPPLVSRPFCLSLRRLAPLPPTYCVVERSALLIVL